MIANSYCFKRRPTTTDYRDCTGGTTSTIYYDDDYSYFTIVEYPISSESGNGNGSKKRHYFDVMSEKKTWKHIQKEHTKVKVKTERLGDFS